MQPTIELLNISRVQIELPREVWTSLIVASNVLLKA